MSRPREVLPRNGQMSLQEIAEHEGISVKTVNITIQCALRKLRHHGLVLKMQELANDLDSRRKGSVEWTQ
jgi:DNA-directed RNA polymerase specialized sigma24 family protein